MELSVCPLSPLNSYSYVKEENLGSTRKLIKNYLLFLCFIPFSRPWKASIGPLGNLALKKNGPIVGLFAYKIVPQNHIDKNYLHLCVCV